MSARKVAAGAGKDDDLLPEIVALGGFSDVGRHTGSERRGTCWPLVRELMKVRLALDVRGGREALGQGAHEGEAGP